MPGARTDTPGVRTEMPGARTDTPGGGAWTNTTRARQLRRRHSRWMQPPRSLLPTQCRLPARQR
eukprot:3289867-Prymnesium_polylepis.1